MTRAAALLGASLLALHLLACSRFRTARQCEELAAIVNGALDEVEALPGRDPPTAAGYEAIAARYDRLATDLKKHEFASANLDKAADDYGKMFASTARNARTFAKALRTNETKKLPAVRSAATQIAGKEKLLVRRVGGLCQP